ncbi:MAG: hypothetical protein AABY65_09420 [Nitrospirota bacterium]
MVYKQMLVRVPKNLATRLERAGKDLHQSQSHIVAEALRFYLAERADLDVALERLRDPNAEWVTHDQVKRDLLGD